MCDVTVSEENCQKNLRAMGKSLKQLETDVKNAENDKMADADDQFVAVMSISLPSKNNVSISLKNT